MPKKHLTSLRISTLKSFAASYACGTCPIAAIWLPLAINFSFVFSLVSPAGFVGSEQDYYQTEDKETLSNPAYDLR